MDMSSSSIVAPCFVGAARQSLRPDIRSHVAPASFGKLSAVSAHDSKNEDAPDSSAVSSSCLLSAFVGAIAMRKLTRTRRSAYQGGGDRGSLSPEQVREIQRNQVATFMDAKKRIMQNGRRPRDDRYWSLEERALFQVSRVAAGINFKNYSDITVECTGGQGIEEPVESFQEICKKFDLPKELVANIERCGYSTPTPVQKYAIPAVLSGSDVMVAAQTGSGKTAAFLVPIIRAALLAGEKPLRDGPLYPTSVVLSPTRELCQQIAFEARRLTFRSNARVCAIYGGESAGIQLRNLSEGCEIIVCTPGRLSDFLDRGVLSMKEVKFLALDEADRMLDMGFEAAIRSITDQMPAPDTGNEAGRQTMMFSATFPQAMQNAALDFLDPSYMWVGVGRVGVATSNVKQRFEDVSHTDKFDKLVEALDGVKSAEGKVARTVVFVNQKATADMITYRLRDNRVEAVAMHGGIVQRERDNALALLRSGRMNVLVATDVAARGLDLPGIDHVVNYDMPVEVDNYVHRIGRTGRIGNTGTATSFVQGSDPHLRQIVSEAQSNNVEVPEWLEQMAH